jgi:3D (Asp-Asp-Asp) domain-containing protein
MSNIRHKVSFRTMFNVLSVSLAGLCLPVVLLWLGCLSEGIRPPSGRQPTVVVMEITGYCNCGKCCGWERSWFGFGAPVFSSGPSKGKRKEVGVTACGAQARHGTVAADTAVLPFGTVVQVPGYGYGRVEDRGGAIKGGRLDLWFPSHDEALKWGRKRVAVNVWKP